LFEQRKAIKEQRALPDDKMTFAQLSDRFLNDVARHTLKPKTFESYEYLLTSHIVPKIGKIKLTNLRPQHIQSLYSEKLDSGLSKKTVHHIHAVTRRVLNQAVKWGLLFQNPTSQVTPPKVDRIRPNVWTVEQAQCFLQSTKDHKWYGIYLIALTTGARRGEILGLTWENIDWDRKTLTIDKTVITVKNRVVISEPKTRYSRRTISAPQTVLDTLYENKGISGLIFKTSVGTPIGPNNLIRDFKNETRKAGLPIIRFHDLRHTCATILFQKDVHPKKVQELLGHSSITVTLDRYSHLIQGVDNQIADEMDKVFNF
jgi:integrase